jgi:hypothetical protein
MDRTQIEQALDACLLTDDEMTGGPLAWVDFSDPIPPWVPGVEHTH